MNRIIRESGKPFWENVDLKDILTPDLFHDVENMSDENFQKAFFCSHGAITVLDRLTGFGWRDVETGFRDKDGKFWLASGGFDAVEACKGMTISETIEWVKANANTCKGE